MHGPEETMEQNMTVWTEFEKIYNSGKAKQIGISNCYDFNTFVSIYHHAKVKPSTL